MRRSLATVTAALALLAATALISAAQAGSSQSAPSKYRMNASAVVHAGWNGTRPVGVNEFSSSAARAKRLQKQ
jgi:Spy/CpxP family protein refolding chaperone